MKAVRRGAPWCTVAVLAACAILSSAYGIREAVAQETKCYFMVCTGSVCVAQQVECPPDPEEETPKEPESPGMPTT